MVHLLLVWTFVRQRSADVRSDPADADIKQTCLFRVTGTCYFISSRFDANPNASVFRDYGRIKYAPNYSHHKVTCFEYADGVNNVGFNDSFQITLLRELTDISTRRLVSILVL